MPEDNRLVLNPNYCIILAEGHTEVLDVWRGALHCHKFYTLSGKKDTSSPRRVQGFSMGGLPAGFHEAILWDLIVTKFS